MRTVMLVFLAATSQCLGEILTNWDARGDRAVIVCIGDSWTSADTITGPLRTMLQSRMGDGGWGYDCVVSGGRSHPLNGYSKTGTWSDQNGTNGASLGASFSADVVTPATFNLTSTVTAFVLHYIVQPGGGSFTYSIDDGAVNTISTDGTSALGFVTNSGLSYASHHIGLTITDAGTTGVGICGIDLQVNNAGCRLDNLGQSGSEASGWLTSGDTNLWKTSIRSLSPTVIMILLGVNECINNRGGSVFSNNLAGLVLLSRSAAPGSDIVLISPADIGVSTTYPMATYNTQVAGIASSLGCGYVNVFGAWGVYGNPKSSGWYLNTTHPNATGGAIIAGYIYDALFPESTISVGTCSVGTLRTQ